MNEEWLEQAAAAERPRLLGLAYRMTGSMTDAEDIVQEAMLRAHRARAADVGSPAAYLTTITTRLAIDHLRSARVRRESYPGPWLPEPIAVDPAADAASHLALRDSLSVALLVLLEHLSPDERAVLVLHDVFAYRHAEIGEILDRSEASSRQLLKRARSRLGSVGSRAETAGTRRDAVVRKFVAACQGGDFDAFLTALTSDVELVFDGGPTVKTAARHPIRGADRVARFLAYAMNRTGPNRRITLTTLNGESAVLIHTDAAVLVGAVFIEPSPDDRATSIRWVRNPQKLTHLR